MTAKYISLDIDGPKFCRDAHSDTRSPVSLSILRSDKLETANLIRRITQKNSCDRKVSFTLKEQRVSKPHGFMIF